MNAVATTIPGVLLLEPQLFGDSRGWFMEVYNRRTFREVVGLDVEFVQDNHSRSERNVLRGLHYQIRRAQGKLVRVTEGSVWDVAVDLRRSSPTFGKWTGMELSAENRRIAWIPPGFAHGFLVKSEAAQVQYKTTDYYAPEHERVIRWDDPDLAVEWPLSGDPIVAERDRAGGSFAKAETYD